MHLILLILLILKHSHRELSSAKERIWREGGRKYAVLETHHHHIGIGNMSLHSQHPQKHISSSDKVQSHSTINLCPTTIAKRVAIKNNCFKEGLSKDICRQRRLLKETALRRVERVPIHLHKYNSISLNYMSNPQSFPTNKSMSRD